MSCTNKSFRGQSLIEIVVAVGIMAVVLVGVSDLISRSLSLANFQRSKDVAVSIAQKQLIYYRQARDLEPTRFFLDSNPQANFSVCVENPDPIKYDCTILYEGIPNGTMMTVSVKWKDGEREITTTLTQILAEITK